MRDPVGASVGVWGVNQQIGVISIFQNTLFKIKTYKYTYMHKYIKYIRFCIYVER